MKRALLLGLIFPALVWANDVSTSYSLEKKGRYKRALALIEKNAKNDVRNYFLQLRTGWLAYLSGQMGKSQRYYQKAVVLKPDAIEPRMGQLLPLIALGKYKQAQSVARTVLRKDQKNYTARSRMAYALFLAGRYKQAQRYYKSLVKDYPSDGQMLIGLGWAQLRQGKKRDALKTFLRAKKILPANRRVSEGIKYAKARQ